MSGITSETPHLIVYGTLSVATFVIVLSFEPAIKGATFIT